MDGDGGAGHVNVLHDRLLAASAEQRDVRCALACIGERREAVAADRIARAVEGAVELVSTFPADGGDLGADEHDVLRKRHGLALEGDARVDELGEACELRSGA